MQRNKKPKLLAGIDNLSLQTINFDPSRDDIEAICRFFSIGKLRHYEKEKGISIAHSSFFVYVATTQGHYALKFYPSNRAKPIAIAYAVNLLLVNHHFPTPLMYTGDGRRPFFTSNGLLVTCHSYIDGIPVWKKIKEQNIIHQINAVMLSLKNILSSSGRRVPLRKQASLTATIKTLTQESRRAAPYGQQKMFDAILLGSCQSYQQYRSLFTRQWIHNNITLTNILIYKKSVRILDLEHVIEDYTLADLSNLIISCLFFEVPVITIKTIIKDYFSQHKIKPEYSIVLNTLIKIELIKEFQKYIKRKKSFYLSERLKLITAVLKKMNNDPGFLTG